MKLFKKVFANGLKVLAPLLLIFVLFYWLFFFIEGIFKNILTAFIGTSNYFVGMGWLTLLVLVILTGILTLFKPIQSPLNYLISCLLKLPIIKNIHKAVSDIIQFFFKDDWNEGAVVSVDTQIGKLVGIITQDDIEKLPEGMGEKDLIAVYIPMSYQIGGFTFIVPKSSVEVLDMSVEEGMALVMTACLSGSEHKKD